MLSVLIPAAVAVFLIRLLRREKQNRALLILLLAADIAGLAAGAAELRSSGREQITQISGESGEEFSLDIETSAGREMTMELQIPEKTYTDREIREKLERSELLLQEEIKGENADLGHVSGNLQLPSSVEETGVSVLWYSDHPELLDDEGVIHAGVPAEGAEVMLTATLSFQGVSEDFTQRVRVYPSVEEGAFRESVDEAAKELNRTGAASDDTWRLPEEAAGERLTWYRREKKRGLMISFLAGAGGLLWTLGRRQRSEEEERARQKEMQSDYPEIVSRLLLYLGAGLSMRSSFARIAGEYRRRRKNGAGKRHAYEEIARCQMRMERGITEAQVYQELGERCGPAGYRALSLLLTQNLKKGSAGVTEQLEREVQEAFEQRKRHARSEGEKATVRLLLPMGMMLAVVLALIIIPAFISL